MNHHSDAELVKEFTEESMNIKLPNIPIKSNYEAELRKVEESNRWIDQLHKSL